MSNCPFYSPIKDWTSTMHFRTGNIRNRKDAWYRSKRKLAGCRYMQRLAMKLSRDIILK